MGDPPSFAKKASEQLGLSPPVEQALATVVNEVNEAYRDRFVELIEVVTRQAAAIDRIQKTLEILVQAVAPAMQGQIPPAVRVAEPWEDADLASAIVVADPLSAGFTLSQKQIADALRLPATDVSILVRAFHLDEEDCAVRVRRGARRDLVNYSQDAIERLRQLILTADRLKLPADAQDSLRRARTRLQSYGG